MITDEQQWNRLKNEWHSSATEFSNFLQTVSVADLENSDTIKMLITMRYHLVDAFSHIFMFIDDANELNFFKGFAKK